MKDLVIVAMVFLIVGSGIGSVYSYVTFKPPGLSSSTGIVSNEPLASPSSRVTPPQPEATKSNGNVTTVDCARDIDCPRNCPADCIGGNTQCCPPPKCAQGKCVYR